jgi:hypothetical protein
MTVDHGSDEIFDWRLVQDAARENAQRAYGDRKGRPNRGKWRQSSLVITSTPSAQLLAFPAGRRVGEIRRLAEQMRRLSYERGESHLQRQLRLKADALRRRGISDAQVLQQISSLEAAVRAELWRRELDPGGFRGKPER